MFSLYEIRNLVNGKIYIGYTNQKVIKRIGRHFWDAQNDLHHNQHLSRSIRKHGRKAFSWNVLSEHDTVADAWAAEEVAIAAVKTATPQLLYNIASGGPGTSGRRMSDESRRKMSAARKGKQVSLEQKERCARQWDAIVAKMRKPVLCCDDGRIFESAYAAARFYNLWRGGITNVCLGKKMKKTGGKVFKYVSVTESDVVIK